MAVAVATITALLACLSPASAFVGPRVGSSLQVGGLRSAAASASHVSMVAANTVENVAAVLLAGGVGKRMEADRPKQFLKLQGKTVLEHSLSLFLSLDGVSQVILVLDEQYRGLFSELQGREPRLVFADPGTERQDSVYNGLQKVEASSSLVCIHDAARPLVTKECVYKVISDADKHGAAVLGVPMKVTVKESEDGDFVLRTIDRTRLWDIQTPQVVRTDLLREGFAKVKQHGWEVTDDVSIVEQLNLPVKLTKGEYTNLKLTTPEDLVIASQIMDARQTGADQGGPKQSDKGEAERIPVIPKAKAKPAIKSRSEGEDFEEEEMEEISTTRADEKWADPPRPVEVESEKEEIVDISEIRANEKWADPPRPVEVESEKEEVVDISEIRANEVWADPPRPVEVESEQEEVSDISEERADEKWVDPPRPVEVESEKEEIVDISEIRANEKWV